MRKAIEVAGEYLLQNSVNETLIPHRSKKQKVVSMRLRALLLASLVMPAAPAFAQEADTSAEDVGQTIIVTGSRRADRTVGESAVPIDLISAEQLNNSGFTETARLLRDLVPSLNFPQPSITDGTDVIRPATLRGLGADQTLVLLNGKRRHASALLNINGSVGRGTQAVDINFIPSSAISQIEVLRDGAAARGLPRPMAAMLPRLTG